ncbi:hypothetical protein L905_24025 [Agrobacterium sp. TS43]|uniref:hypothetical protein n=1 Tax=Agrobacterium TaxID=357 RepID=UPI000745A5DE|nr:MULTISPECIES: hypothetical protein [Agrobacterium]KVK57602.1 hypothetical protein L906_26965 [Agrobacterium sp. TS45]KVK58047.1 hypothetical protein L905_24025 [Agrobacterium sp. TS43]KVK61005.1 hypothetical protein L907_26850 [Agrobacterium sp. C13]
MFSEVDNTQRAAWARIAIDAFMKATLTDEGDAVSDLLCNLMHYCRESGMDFLAELNQGALHFQAEIEIEENDDADPAAMAENPHHYQRHDGMAG